MKLNKRIKSALIQTFFFNVVLLIVVIAFVALKIWPSFQEIENKKTSLTSSYSNLISVQKTGIDIADFQSLSDSSDQNGYVKETIKNISDDFYSRNFINTVEVDFDRFLELKQEKVLSEQKASLLEERTDMLGKILPSYVSDSSQEGITDFEFINYVESLLYSFNLVSQDSLGIGELKKLEDEYADTNNDLDSNMFYIPLSLELTGQKGDIIDFIHYLENVGSIDILDGGAEVYSDQLLSNDISSDSSDEDQNIYRNQFSDIEMISMQTYIDTSSAPVQGSFTDFIKATQDRQRFSVEMDLRFYVQGLPDYKIESYVDSVLEMHGELLSESKKSLQLTVGRTGENSSSSLRAINSIKSLSNILILMQDDMKSLRIALAKKDQDLGTVYDSAKEHQERLETIEKILQESILALNSK